MSYHCRGHLQLIAGRLSNEDMLYLLRESILINRAHRPIKATKYKTPRRIRSAFVKVATYMKIQYALKHYTLQISPIEIRKPTQSNSFSSARAIAPCHL